MFCAVFALDGRTPGKMLKVISWNHWEPGMHTASGMADSCPHGSSDLKQNNSCGAFIILKKLKSRFCRKVLYITDCESNGAIVISTCKNLSRMLLANKANGGCLAVMLKDLMLQHRILLLFGTQAS